jgi:hypothetical protein
LVEDTSAAKRNAVRHGLTAETVIGVLEDAEDYRQFEAAVIADYDAQSAVERELVSRLASPLWQLRRATTMETGLFEIQAEHLRSYRQTRQLLPHSQGVIDAVFGRAELDNHDSYTADRLDKAPTTDFKHDSPATEFAQCFLRLVNLPNFALDRLSPMKQRFGARLARSLCARSAGSAQTPGAKTTFSKRSPHV